MNIKQSPSNQQKGFTLVEIVVVIVVIGILAAVALPRFLGLSEKAHDAVVEGAQSALASGVIMAKSAWLIHGKQTALDNIVKQSVNGTTVGLDANNDGYPVGYTFDATDGAAAKANNITTNAECVEVFEFLLSDQSLKAQENCTAATCASTTTFSATACTGTTCSTLDSDFSDLESCLYTYIPSDSPTRAIHYDSVTGKVQVTGLIEAEFSAGS